MMERSWPPIKDALWKGLDGECACLVRVHVHRGFVDFVFPSLSSFITAFFSGWFGGSDNWCGGIQML